MKSILLTIYPPENKNLCSILLCVFLTHFFALISNDFANLSIAQQVRQRMSISLLDHWPFGVSWGSADEIVVRFDPVI